jgi:competence protein ComEA
MSLFSQSVAATGDGTAARKQRADGEHGSRTTRAAAVSGGRDAAPTPIPRISRLRSSVWWPAVGKGAAISVGMLALATIGAVFTLRRPPGVALAHGNSVSIDSAWIKPDTAVDSAPRPRTPHSDPALSATRLAADDAPKCEPSAGKECPKPDAPPPGAGITPDGKVILNTATADELTHLPGVGPKRAQAIVALRTRLKRFKSPSDLLRVKGIGPKGLKKMLPHLVLDPPAAPG